MPAALVDLDYWLEVELSTQFQDAVAVDGGNLTEVAVMVARIYAAPLRMVEEVERLEAQLDVRTLAACERDVLRQGEVEVDQARSDHGILAGGAEALGCATSPRSDWIGERGERAIYPGSLSMGIADLPYQVCTVAGAAAQA